MLHWQHMFALMDLPHLWEGGVLDEGDDNMRVYPKEDITFEADSMVSVQIRGGMGDGLLAIVQVVSSVDWMAQS